MTSARARRRLRARAAADRRRLCPHRPLSPGSRRSCRGWLIGHLGLAQEVGETPASCAVSGRKARESGDKEARNPARLTGELACSGWTLTESTFPWGSGRGAGVVVATPAVVFVRDRSMVVAGSRAGPCRRSRRPIRRDGRRGDGARRAGPDSTGPLVHRRPSARCGVRGTSERDGRSRGRRTRDRATPARGASSAARCGTCDRCRELPDRWR